MSPAEQVHLVITLLVADVGVLGVSLTVLFIAAPRSVAVVDVLTVITPAVTSMLSTYCVCVDWQPAAVRLAGSDALLAAYSATDVLQAPAAARASETFERIT